MGREGEGKTRHVEQHRWSVAREVAGMKTDDNDDDDNDDDDNDDDDDDNNDHEKNGIQYKVDNKLFKAS